MKKLITAQEVRNMAEKGGGEIHIGRDQLITPGARDLAVELGLKVIFSQPPASSQAPEPVPADVRANVPYVPLPESLRAAGHLQSPGCPPTLAGGPDPGLVDRITRLVMERTVDKAGGKPDDQPGEELIRTVVSAVINRLKV